MKDKVESAAREVLAIGHEEHLTDEQLAAVKQFVEEVGGIENARQAIAALKELKTAA
jgi:hypothetical protein